MIIMSKRKIIGFLIGAAWLSMLLIGLACNYFDLINPYGPDYGYWAKSYGGLNHEQFNSLYVTSEETALLAGTTDTYGAGNGSAWLVNVDKQGQVLWQQAYDFIDNNTNKITEVFSDLIQGRNRQFLAAVNLIESDSYDREIDTDFCLLRLDASGKIIWYKEFASAGKEAALVIREVPATNPATSPGMVVAGYLDYNRHFLEHFTQADLDKDYAAFVLKLDNTGNIEWQTILSGGPLFDEACAITQTKDGGFFAGGTRSTERGDSDYWLFKLGSSGGLEANWSKTFGGAGDDFLRTIEPTSDGGLLLSGISSSLSGAEIPPPGKTRFSHWVLKLNSEGGIEWQKRYAVTDVNGDGWKNYKNAIRELAPGQYLLALTAPPTASGTADFGILKLDQAGNIIWQKRYGGADSDEAAGLRLLPSGGYLTAGQTRSFTSGGYDFWTIRLLPNGYCPPLDQDGLFKAEKSFAAPRTFNVEIQGTGKQPFSMSVQATGWTVTKTYCTVKQQAP